MNCYDPENYKNAYPPTRWKELPVAFGTARVPASLGTSKTYPPAQGLYTNKIVKYEADDTVWLYDSFGNYTPISSLVSVNGKTGAVTLKMSDITNDSGYITEDTADSLYVDLVTYNSDISALEARVAALEEKDNG